MGKSLEIHSCKSCSFSKPFTNTEWYCALDSKVKIKDPNKIPKDCTLPDFKLKIKAK